MTTFEDRQKRSDEREKKCDDILTAIHGLVAGTHTLVIDRDDTRTKVWFEVRS